MNDEVTEIEGNVAQPFLTHAQILGKVDLKTTTVYVPDWGGNVILRELSGKQRDKVEFMLSKGKNRGDNYEDVRAVALSMSMVDSQGHLMFSGKEDIQALNRLSGKVLQDLVEVVFRISGISTEGEQELEKNSESTPDEDNGSD